MLLEYPSLSLGFPPHPDGRYFYLGLGMIYRLVEWAVRQLDSTKNISPRWTVSIARSKDFATSSFGTNPFAPAAAACLTIKLPVSVEIRITRVGTDKSII